MRSAHAPTSATKRFGLLGSPRGRCARLVVAWTLAGGITGGGLLVSALTVAGSISPGLQLLAAPVLFLLGALSGAAHGLLLAVLGRPDPLSGGGAFRASLLGLVVALPALGPAWVVTAAVSLTAALVGEWRTSWALLSAGGWLLGGAACWWALREGWEAVGRAYTRWEGGRLGALLTATILVGASLALLHLRPTIWGTDLRLNAPGALAAALALTLWVGLPLVWVMLHLANGLFPQSSRGGEAGT